MQRFLGVRRNHHPILWTLAIVLLGALAALEWRNRARGTINLSIFDFTRQINSNNTLLIDLRPGADFDKGHIRGARHLTPSRWILRPRKSASSRRALC